MAWNKIITTIILNACLCLLYLWRDMKGIDLLAYQSAYADPRWSRNQRNFSDSNDTSFIERGKINVNVNVNNFLNFNEECNSQLFPFNTAPYLPLTVYTYIRVKSVTGRPKTCPNSRIQKPIQNPNTQLQSNSQKLQRWICLGRVVLLPYMLLHNV